MFIVKDEEKNGFVRTDTSVSLPYDIPYDMIAGGACRDTLVGKMPRDYDLYYHNKKNYIMATKELIDLGFKLKKISSMQIPQNSNCLPDATWSRWKKDDVKYDVFLMEGMEPEIIEKINRFDFTVNVCFQTSWYGSIFIKRENEKHYKHRQLVVNKECSENGRLIQRILKFKKQGWDFHYSSVQRVVENFEKDIDCYDNGSYYRYSGKKTKQDLKKFVSLLSIDDFSTLFLSKNKLVMTAAKKEYEKRMSILAAKRYLKNFIGIGI